MEMKQWIKEDKEGVPEKKKLSKEFEGFYCMARKDPEGDYEPKNCYWREALSDKEARDGIEDIGITEPENIPLTQKQEKERAKMPKEQREMFDIWARMMWRATHYGTGKN